MYFILFYETVADYVTKRAPYREEHLGLAKAAHERGELVIAGALADPADRAVLVFKGQSPAAAEAFAHADPYVRNGLVVQWSVRPWTVVIGSDLQDGVAAPPPKAPPPHQFTLPAGYASPTRYAALDPKGIRNG